MARVKVTGFIDPDDYGADPDDASGLSEEGFEALQDDIGYKLENCEVERVDDDG